MLVYGKYKKKVKEESKLKFDKTQNCIFFSFILAQWKLLQGKQRQKTKSASIHFMPQKTRKMRKKSLQKML